MNQNQRVRAGGQQNESGAHSATLWKSAPEKERSVYEALAVVSPGEDEEGQEKNQDRLMLMEIPDNGSTKCQLAIVCDGVTSSPAASAAAEYVSTQVHLLFQEAGLQRTAEGLRKMRLALVGEFLSKEAGRVFPSESKSKVSERLRHQNSYQTTFVAVCLKRNETNSAGTISIKAIGCGDSALFIFRDDGKLLYNNLNIRNEKDQFRHGLPFVAVLPDGYDEETGNVLFDFEEYPEDVQLLLCSDGLYDGFSNFEGIRAWFSERRSKLVDSTLRYGCLGELHHNLTQKGADDDVSFIWLYPKKDRTSA